METPPPGRGMQSRNDYYALWRETVASTVEYPNLRSRLLLSRSFERQSPIPRRKPYALMVKFFQWYENTLLKVDTSNIAIDRPIFLIGLPRSGTTMLQDLMCTHPDLAYITNSMHTFRYAICAIEDMRTRLGLDFKGQRFIGDSVEVSPGSPNEGHLLFTEWADIDIYSLEYKERHKSDFTPEQIEQGRELIRRVLWCFSREDGVPKRFFNKNPGHIAFFPLLNEIYPDAKFIHIVRDPRMCANSMLKLYHRNIEQEKKVSELLGSRDDAQDQYFVPYPRLPKLAEYMQEYGGDDLRTTANLWNDAILFVEEHKEALANFYEVRYEDILENPQEEVHKLLDFCELDEVTDRSTEFWQKLDQVGVVQHVNKYGDFELIEAICHENMQKYGYQ